MNKTQRGTTVGMKGGKGQNATELLTSKGALHPEKLGPVHLVTEMDVSIGNRTLWSVLPVQVRL